MTRLPVDEALPELLEALRVHGAAVLEAPPGSGKTTRVPPALAGSVPGQVWVLEPRRIAARAAARRVAEEWGEPVGERCGYVMRFERKVGPRTRVVFATEGVLARRLDDFDGIDAIVLDEFHERSIHTDVILAWARTLRARRPELKLVVMSATLDGEKLAGWLGCPRIRAEGRMFPVEIRHAERRDERVLHDRVTAAVRATDGDTLVFLPGKAEIGRVAERLGDLDCRPLHGELDAAAQDRALSADGSGRRVILATNVAETSLTVAGIVTVVDSGLARIPGHDPWSGLLTLDLGPIARANAAQRAGRAGRTAPGLCLRLYSKADHDARPAALPPEILRADLAGLVLALGGRELPWFDAPPRGAWEAALALLRRLGALDDAGVTSLGRRMLELPLHPRLARVALEGGTPETARMIVALEGRGDGDPVALAAGADTRDSRQIAAMLRGGHGDLSRALFAGFPDRVGRREGSRIRFADGGSAAVEPGRDGYVLVAAAERSGNAVRARMVTPVPADWLVEGAEVLESMRWTGERVEVVEELRFGALVLDRSVGRGDPEAVAGLLAEHAEARHFADAERAETLVRRVAYLRRVGVDLPALDLDLRAACRDCRSLADLASVSLFATLRGRVDLALVDRLAPETVALPGRPRAAVAYDADEPYLASRMQDFFGLGEGPSIAGGPLVLHLLAPNQRPVQVTRDLSGFWARHWPAIRKELMRRYPRHAWPEDPRHAPPPEPRRR